MTTNYEDETYEEDYYADEDDSYYEDLAEEEYERLLEMAFNCKCGAWHVIKGEAIHVADCVCGAA